MSKTSFIPDLIPYNEMHHFLKEKFNITHEELRYWIKMSLTFIKDKFYDIDEDITLYMEDSVQNDVYLLFPYVSDLPDINSAYQLSENEFFYPEYCFYSKQAVLQFKPSYHLRFVYQKDLTGKRNWNDYRIGSRDSPLSKILLKANEHGMLRFYDYSIDEFTRNATPSQKWCQSFEGEEYIKSPESFFLLCDILNVERVFLGKNKELCLNELGIKPLDLPKNVINLKKKKD